MGSWERQWVQKIELGPIAQLGARLNGIEKVEGSNPSGSINKSVHFGRFFHWPIAHEAPIGSLGARLNGIEKVVLQ
mgnify:CR=1 FL=1